MARLKDEIIEEYAQKMARAICTENYAEYRKVKVEIGMDFMKRYEILDLRDRVNEIVGKI